MRRFFRFLLVLWILYASWFVFKHKLLHKTDYQSAIDKINSEINDVKENPDFSASMDILNNNIKNLAEKLNNPIEKLQQKQEEIEYKPLAKPKLTTPVHQIFSINNIEIGDSKIKLEQRLGAPKRSSYNEYGIKWYVYHKNYQHFMMVAYDKNNKVAGLYSNQDLIASTKGIKLGSPKDLVLKRLGAPLTKIQKGFIYYTFPQKRDYDLFLLGNAYTTIFYDKHQHNTVTSIQIISKELEQRKSSFYTKATKQIKAGFEYQLFDLTNAARVQHGLHPLNWDNRIKLTAQNHSIDMADHHYFDHTNLQGQSPFDRMTEDQIHFTVAGENIAYGQFSSIFAHEGLMNSLGHRENILRPDFEYLGVGVAFNSNSEPYYTEDFYTK